MNTIITKNAIQFSATHLPIRQVEEDVVSAGLRLGGTKIHQGVEIPLLLLGVKKGPSKTLSASFTVSYHNHVLQLYGNQSDRKSLAVLRFLKDEMDPKFDTDPWHCWQLRKWIGKVSLLEIRIPQAKPDPAAK